MSTHIDTKITSQGVLIPLPAIQEWLERGLEVVKDKEQIIIRPKSQPLAGREQILQLLEEAGLLAPPEPLPTDYRPLSPETRQALSEKLGRGQPLSEIIIEERADRV
ncbi:MAG: hypothetical protein AB1801_09885 [Chloroflexota bacterium]